MSTKAAHNHSEEKMSFAQKINDFLAKSRTVILVTLAVLVIALGAIFAYSVINDNRKEAAFESVDSVVTKWEEARAASDKSGLAASEDGFIASLQKVADSNKANFGGTRANMAMGEIYFSRKDWQNAQKNYLAAISCSPNAYTAGINYFNAGVCADELGNPEDAVKYLTKASECENFAMKSRALFNLGRVEEQRSNKDAALAAYGKLVEKYPDDDWSLLAESRIIALKIQ
ncbi:MAG TPA: tetratricopeptide repeat protein [Treponemataceae bacterium]|nr:tetratricopeptide repeat protein [Treponemataceae bacterium]